MRSVYVLHGPNLNLLGTRRPAIYGTTTLADLEARCAARAAEHGLEAVCRQTNHEGELVDWIHEAGVATRDGRSVGAVVNAGAYTHTSIALHDAVEGSECPVVEVHLSNVHAREPFRHHSYLSPVARGVVVGFGVPGYVLAIDGLVALTDPGGAR